MEVISILTMVYKATNITGRVPPCKYHNVWVDVWGVLGDLLNPSPKQISVGIYIPILVGRCETLGHLPTPVSWEIGGVSDMI